MSRSREELQQKRTVAVGISPDRPEKQRAFADKYDLKISLLSDVDHAVAEAYGVWGEKSKEGQKTEGIIRSCFLVDEQGKILQAWYNIDPAETVPKAMEVLS